LALSIRVQWLPKAGNHDDEYEDAAWPERSLATTQPVVRCAVADGATESAFAGMWARQLVRAYGSGALDGEEWWHGLAREQTAWRAAVVARPLSWYAEEKARSGAFAALLGVTFGEEASNESGGERAWQALAMGDCALFQVRDDALLTSFPAGDAGFFTNRPLLIGSAFGSNAALTEHIQRTSGALQPGDRLYLVSDALGHWWLQAVERGATPWNEVDNALARRRRGFSSWVDSLRRGGQMRNDDVTLLRVTWAER
jgi:serine/threonine protein phosphatase PrpC